MSKIDLKKELKGLYTASAKKPGFVEVPVMSFLMIDGKGDPNKVPEFGEAVQALYSVAYTLKFMLKKMAAGPDYTVMPLEGLWWVEDMTLFSPEDKDSWQWTVMIMQPEWVAEELYCQALKEVAAKKNPAALPKMRFQGYNEGLSAQLMHIGPYSEEGPTVEKLHDFIRTNGHELTGKHHEIYLSDPRKAAPEKWKTIVRQPMK